MWLHGWRLRALLLSIAASAAGYVAFSLWSGWHEVAAALARIGIVGTLAALSLSLVNYGLRFVRWQIYLATFGHAIPHAASLRIYLAGFALTTTPGKMGETLRGVFLKPYGVSYPQSLAAFFSERLSDTIAGLLFTALGLWLYPPARPVVLLLGAAVALILVLLQRPNWLRVAARRLPARLAGLTAAATEIVAHSGRCFRLPLLATGILLGIFAWGAEGVAFHYATQLLGSDISLQTALFIYAFSMLVGALSFLPGGLGSAEFTMIALLLLNGMSQPMAVAVTVLIRLATLWFAVVLGIGALLGLQPKTNATVPHGE